MIELKKQYDLEERTTNFGVSIIDLCKQLQQDAVSRPIISQLVRSGTSIGANYREANSASSKLDFKNKIYICKKEAEETKYWLIIIRKCFPEKQDKLRILWKECQELTLIFGKIVSSLRNSKLNRNSSFEIKN